MKKKFYLTKMAALCSGIVLVASLIFLGGYDYHKIWNEKKELEKINLAGMRSQLEEQEYCYLCGSSNESLMSYYRKIGTVGIISLNNWYVTDLKIKNLDKEVSGGMNSVLTNIDGVSMYSEGIPEEGFASLEVKLSAECKVDYELLRENLCQPCLEKILSALKEEKAALPLCLVDFQTLHIYSLQDVTSKYSIRDYQIVASHKENEVIIEAQELTDN